MRGVARTCLRRAREKEGEERAWGRGRGEGECAAGGARATIGIYTCKCGSTKRSYISVTLP